MNITSQLLRLYSAPTEGEEIRSIIAFRKHPIAIRYEFDMVTARIYNYKLRVNLWFIVLSFGWEKEVLVSKE